MCFKLLLLLAILCVSLSYAVYIKAEDKPQVVKFRPITREEYNEILKLTDGKPTISEARLIGSGLAVFKNLVTFTSGFWPNVLSVFGITQTSAADVEDSQVGSYPLCVVQTDKIGKQQNYEGESSGLDCIIVVRENEEPEEHYEQEYYEDFAPMNMLPDYQHWPYGATAVPPPPPPPPPTPMAYNPYFPTPYAYNPYQFYPYYSGYAPVYAPPSPQIPFAPLPQSQLGNPGELLAQNQQQAQQQSDFYQQSGFAPYQLPYHPQFATAPPAPAQTNHNANNGPVVHVIRGDKRDLGGQQQPLKVRRYSVGPPRRKAIGEERQRRKSFRKLDENGYRKTYVPKQQYRDTYPKVSLSRSAEYNHPVYIMNAEDLY